MSAPHALRARPLRLAALAILCVAGAAAGTVAADSDVAPAASAGEGPLLAEIPKVISASRYEQGVNEAPASITIVTAEEIRRFGYRTLADVLRNTRGFYVSNDRNYEFAGARGFGRPGDYSNRLMVMIDGHAHNDRWSGGNYIGRDFGVDLDLVERIEIVRGPASALYGSNALFAVVNVITRRVEDAPGAALRADGGSWAGGGAAITYGRPLGPKKGLLAGAGGFVSDGQDLFYPAFDDPATNFGVAEGADGEAHADLFGRLRLGDWTIEGKANVRRKQIPTASFGTRFNDSGTWTSDARSFLEARHDRLTASGAESTARFYFDRLDYQGDYVFAGPPVTVNRDEGGADWLGVEYRWSRRLGRRHRLVAGGQYEYSLRVFQRNYDEDPYLSRLDQKFRYFNYSVYALDEISLGRRVLLNLGVRHDKYQTFGQSIHPRIAAIFSPRRTTTIKLLHGSAFRTPTVYEAYYDDGGYSIKPNPGLRSEEIHTSEIVWEQALGPRFSLVGTAYRYEIDDLIGQFEDPGDLLVQFRNQPRVTAHGLEFEIAGRSIGGVFMRGAYSRQRAENRDGSILSNSPAHLVQTSLAWPVLRGRSEVALQARYLSPRLTLGGGRTRSVAVGDLTLRSGTLWRGIDVSLAVRNLFDRRHADPASNEHTQDEIPQDGRHWFLSMRHRF